MAHFAQIDDNNIVLQVLVIDQAEIDTGHWGDPTKWIQTSYNTHNGIHYIPNTNPPEPSPDQSKALRKNYAGIGFTYDPVLDAFIPPKPYPSWIFNPQYCNWEAPVPMPTDKYCVWDESIQNWNCMDPVAFIPLYPE